MTPLHGVDHLKDTGEREAAKTAADAHMFACWDKKDGPGYELREKVDKLRLQGAAMGGVLALISIIGPVWLAWWLSNRFPAQQAHHSGDTPALVNQALAATKGTP